MLTVNGQFTSFSSSWQHSIACLLCSSRPWIEYVIVISTKNSRTPSWATCGEMKTSYPSERQWKRVQSGEWATVACILTCWDLPWQIIFRWSFRILRIHPHEMLKGQVWTSLVALACRVSISCLHPLILWHAMQRTTMLVLSISTFFLLVLLTSQPEALGDTWSDLRLGSHVNPFMLQENSKWRKKILEHF